MSRFLPNALWILLLPLSVAWAAVCRFRRNYFLTRSHRATIPVVSIGNLHSGGTGKSPVTRAVYQALQDFNPVILSRGYRGKKSQVGAEVCLNDANAVELFGDEPCMFTEEGMEVYVGANRWRTIQKFNLGSRYGALILDDGFQHVKLARTADLVLLPTWKSVMQNWCLPLGPLRESVEALAGASALLLMQGEFLSQWRGLCKKIAPGVPRFEIAPPKITLIDRAKRPVERSDQVWGAFCGIAEPERFRDWIHPQVFCAFQDHHRYSAQDIRGLVAKGTAAGVTAWVTTQKDSLKVSPLWPKEAPPLYLSLVQYSLPSPLIEWIRSKVAAC